MMTMKLGAAILAAVLPVSATNAALVFTEAMSGSDNSGSKDSDWIELTNTGPAPVNLNGFTFDDDTTPGDVTFGNVSIATGETVILLELGSVDGLVEAEWRTLFNVPAGLNVINSSEFAAGSFPGMAQGGETINLYDTSSSIVATATFGAATAGVSFEWDNTGASLGLSIAGENGAYAATGDNGGIADVGSPGLVVPEPASVALIGLGGLLIARRRRA